MGLYGSPQVGNAKDDPKELINQNLIKCPECGAYYSKSTFRCPICGTYNEKFKRDNPMYCSLHGKLLAAQCSSCGKEFCSECARHCTRINGKYVCDICGGKLVLIPEERKFYSSGGSGNNSRSHSKNDNSDSDINISICPNCNTKCTSKYCPNCGCRTKNKASNKEDVKRPRKVNIAIYIFFILIFVTLIYAFASYAMNSPRKDIKIVPNSTTLSSYDEKVNYIRACTDYDYDDLIRNPKYYIGKRAKFTGKVVQIMEGLLSTSALRVDIGNGEIIYVIYTVDDKSSNRIIEDDNIIIYGEMDELETYTTVLRTQITIPKINAKYIDKYTPVKIIYSYGDTFEFDNLEITFTDNITWHKIDNEYSNYYGYDIFSVPVTITNLSSESYSMYSFNYTIFAPSGLSVDEASYYFDDSVSSASDMRSGTTQTTNIYVVYDGDGEYVFEFDKFSGEKAEVALSVIKP